MAQYIQFSIFLISVPNLIVIGLMVLVFALGIVFALPHANAEQEVSDGQ